ncbi:Hypothetical predicted protein [Paramuricea clavata]|uniref:Uncharacterized protein n=1 Tax=Paramuricea clavata TaxID=317549 RepID=A0A7D9J2B2_PARCT|nr:Hypothetical predicted protein [Paramuricea clavata]
MVYLGWKHFKEQEKAYTLVPLVKGGGSRVIEMPLTSCKTDIYQTCKNFFFPDGNSIFGNEDDMLFSLTNFKARKIRTVRLYLQSRKIDGSDDDDDLLSSAFDHDLNQEGSLIGPHLERQSLVSRNQESSLINSTLDMQSLVSQNQESSLIGSTLERQSLASEQDKEYQKSLKVDE